MGWVFEVPAVRCPVMSRPSMQGGAVNAGLAWSGQCPWSWHARHLPGLTMPSPSRSCGVGAVGWVFEVSGGDALADERAIDAGRSGDRWPGLVGDHGPGMPVTFQGLRCHRLPGPAGLVPWAGCSSSPAETHSLMSGPSMQGGAVTAGLAWSVTTALACPSPFRACGAIAFQVLRGWCRGLGVRAPRRRRTR